MPYQSARTPDTINARYYARAVIYAGDVPLALPDSTDTSPRWVAGFDSPEGALLGAGASGTPVAQLILPQPGLWRVRAHADLYAASVAGQVKLSILTGNDAAPLSSPDVIAYTDAVLDTAHPVGLDCAGLVRKSGAAGASSMYLQAALWQNTGASQDAASLTLEAEYVRPL